MRGGHVLLMLGEAILQAREIGAQALDALAEPAKDEVVVVEVTLVGCPFNSACDGGI
jgi:hypothetical protein